jgi:hypothetical protein
MVELPLPVIAWLLLTPKQPDNAVVNVAPPAIWRKVRRVAVVDHVAEVSVDCVVSIVCILLLLRSQRMRSSRRTFHEKVLSSLLMHVSRL